MKTLLSLFFKIILQQAAKYLVISTIAIIVFEKIFGGYEYYIGMLVLLAPLIAWMVSFSLVPKNLNWILLSSLRRRTILLINYIVSLLCSFVFFLTTCIVLLITALAHFDSTHSNINRLGPLKGTAKLANAIDLRSTFVSNFFDTDIYGLATLVIMFIFFHALAISITHANYRAQSTSSWLDRFGVNALWFHPNNFLRLAFRLAPLPIAVLAYVCRAYLVAPFGLLMVFAFIFLILVSFASAHALVLSVRQRRWFVFGNLSFGFVLMAFLFSQSLRALGTQSDSNSRAAALIFLGPYARVLNEEQILEGLLKSPLKSERVLDVSNRYLQLQQLPRGHRLGLDTPERRRLFSEVVQSKIDIESLIASLSLFQLNTLTSEELFLLLEKASGLFNQNAQIRWPHEEFLFHKISDAVLLRMMTSPSRLVQQYIILRGRYGGLPTPLLKKLVSGSKAAVYQLLAVDHEHVYYLDWPSYLLTKELAQYWLTAPNCDDPRSDGLLNYCIRKNIYINQNKLKFREVESAGGWLKLGLSNIPAS